MEVSLSNGASNERRKSQIKDLAFPVTLKKKTKKSSKKKKKENAEDLQSLEQGLQFPGRNFVAKPECRILFKKTAEIFNRWLSWQRKILICGLTDRCSKSLLRTMTTVVEPILPAKVAGQSRLEIVTRQKEAKSFAALNEFECPTIQEGNSKVSFRKSASNTSNVMRSKSPFIEELGGAVSATATQDIQERTSKLSFRKDASSTSNVIGSKSPFIEELALGGAASTTATHDVQISNSPSNSFLPDIAQICSPPLTAQYYITNHKHHKRDSVVRPTKNFFPDIMFAKGLGKVCVIKSVIQDEAGNRYSSKLFKNRKWWPRSAPESAFLIPSGRKLLENFRNSLESIYQWFTDCNDAEQGDCILQVLPLFTQDELEYFSLCILQRLKERTDIDRLPDNVMLNVFRNLTTNELLTAGQVCRRWHYLTSDQYLWREKCESLGIQNDVHNIIEEIELVANGDFINWKRTYLDLYVKFEQRKARLQELATMAREDLISNDDESSVSTDYLDDEESTTDVDVTAASDGGESSVISGMSEFLNGNLGMMENTVQQMSNQARVEDAIEDTALDIRPENTEQAQNRLVATSNSELENSDAYKLVNVDQIWSLKRVRKLQGHQHSVLAIQFDRKRVISGSADRTIRVWDVRSGRSIHKLKGHKGGVRALQLDNEYIITGSWDMTIAIWSAVKFKRIMILHGHKDCVSCLDTNEDILLSGSHDKTLKIWDKISWTCIKTLRGHQGCITCLSLLENGLAISGATDRALRLWNLEDGCCTRIFHGSQDAILTLKVCGDLVAAGSQDGTLLFWDLKNGKCEAMILAHTGPLYSISFSGARFVTAGGDQLVKEWDLATCSCLRSLTGHKDVVLCVQTSSKRIVSGSADGSVRIWDLVNHTQQVL